MRKHLLLLVLMVCASANADSTRWFQTTEQSLMDAIATGDKAVWDRAMDPSCVLTTEEGQVMTREQFLASLRPLPSGLTGAIAVKELTAQEFPSFAVVRFMADEWENVFGQRLTTKYRVTDTFRRAGSGWTMIASHVSVIKQNLPAQNVLKTNWPALAGTYERLPTGWTFMVDFRAETI